MGINLTQQEKTKIFYNAFWSRSLTYKIVYMVRNQQKHSGNKHHDDCVAILWAVPNEHCMLLNLAGSENVNWHFRVLSLGKLSNG